MKKAKLKWDGRWWIEKPPARLAVRFPLETLLRPHDSVLISRLAQDLEMNQRPRL